jgi:hypothetical protein
MILLNLLGIASCTFVLVLLIIMVAASIRCLLEAESWGEVIRFILFAIFFITAIYSINVFIIHPLWINIFT